MKSEEETELRVLRAKVYGECTDANWEAVKENWAKPESKQWLKDRIKEDGNS